MGEYRAVARGESGPPHPMFSTPQSHSHGHHHQQHSHSPPLPSFTPSPQHQHCVVPAPTSPYEYSASPYYLNEMMMNMSLNSPQQAMTPMQMPNKTVMMSPYDPALAAYFQQQAQTYLMAAHIAASGVNPWSLLGPTAAVAAAGAAGQAEVWADPNHRVPATPYYNSEVTREPKCTWSGSIPRRSYKNPMYSCKIFIGGVPWDITDGALLDAFRPFGSVRVEWPGKEARYHRSKPRGKGTGYVYMIYDEEKSVRNLLNSCSQDFGTEGDWYFKLTAKRLRTKEIRQVQVIPWVISDSNFVHYPAQHLDPKKTVFVGALHGMVTAEVLAGIMNDLFGNVVYAGIDTDKFKYPIGSGRVTFSTSKSYFKAINSAFVEIKTGKFCKKVQIDPFLEDSPCSGCNQGPGPYFCRESSCFKYFCRICWQNHHKGELNRHKPLMRNTRRIQEFDTPPNAPQQQAQSSSDAVEASGSQSQSHSPPSLPQSPGASSSC